MGLFTIWPQNSVLDLFEGLGGYRPHSSGYNISESDTAYLISMDIPGVRREDLKIEIDRDVLIVSGERKIDGKTCGTVNQSFSLSNSIDTGEIKAKHEDGVLELSLPKKQESKRRLIKL